MPTMSILCHRSYGRFTLLELLVVLTICMILASLLFPAFNGALGQSRSTLCANNLAQLGVATSSYTNDCDERYPASWNLKSDALRNAWSGLEGVAPYFYTGSASTTLTQFYGSGLVRCPELAFTSSLFHSYGMNQETGRPSGVPVGLRISRIRFPSYHLLLGDGGDNQPEVFAYAADKKLRGRHSNALNFLCPDNHLESMDEDLLLLTNWRKRILPRP